MYQITLIFPRNFLWDNCVTIDKLYHCIFCAFVLYTHLSCLSLLVEESFLCSSSWSFLHFGQSFLHSNQGSKDRLAVQIVKKPIEANWVLWYWAIKIKFIGLGHFQPHYSAGQYFNKWKNTQNWVNKQSNPDVRMRLERKDRWRRLDTNILIEVSGEREVIKQEWSRFEELWIDCW